VPSTWLNTVGRMLGAEPALAPPTMNSRVKRSAGALTGPGGGGHKTRAGGGRLGVEKVGRRDARRLRQVLHDDGRLSGDVLGQVSGEEAAGEVVVVADPVADDHPELLVAVELLRFARAAASDAEGETDHGDRFVPAAPINDRHPEVGAKRASKEERPGPAPFGGLASLGHLRVTGRGTHLQQPVCTTP